MRLLIVGAGGIGEVHIRALRRFDDVRVAICDNRQENLDKFGSMYNIDEQYTDYRAALAQGRFDAVTVCTPNHLHAPVAVAAAQAGCHILCEKPMAATPGQAREMLAAAEGAGVKLMVAYILRQFPALKRLKEITESGVLGKIVSARVVLATPETLDVALTTYRKSFETGGGILYDYTHELDYCRYLLGEPDYGFCVSRCALKSELTVDDNADMVMSFKSGAGVTIHMDYIQYTGREAGGGLRKIEIVGEKGFAYCDFKKVRVEMYDDGSVSEDSYARDFVENFYDQYKVFFDIIKGADLPYVTGADGLAVLQMAAKLYESSQGRKPVYF